MSSYQKNPIRLISAVVIGCFLLQDAAWAAPTTLAPSPITAAATAQAAISQFALNPSQLQIPLQAVTLQEVHVGTNGRLIIHIQDAHANLSGQQSLAKALDHFMSQYDLKVVLVEGSARDSSLDEIRKLAPIKEWQIIARRFLYDGIISGEEYLNLTTEHPMKILGIEYRDLYDESIRAYASLVDRRNDILHYLYKSKVSLDRLKAKFYTREIRDYEAKKGADDSGLTDFKTGFSNLLELADKAGYPLTDLPNTQKLKSLLDKEKTIRFDQANAEQQKILESLSASGAASDVKEFIEASKRLKTSQVSQYLLIKNLFKTAEDKKLALDSMPELKAYERYLSEFLDLKLDSLLAELDLLEDRVYEQLLPSEDARKVRAIDRFLGLLGNAYKLQMSSRDFGMFTFNEKDFPTESWLAFMNQKLAELGFFESMIPYQKYLEDARKDFGKFYELVGQRDQAFVENAARLMKEQNTDAAILIAGGYHTAHLTELLRQEGTSYVVLTPVVTDTTDHERYEELLLQHLKQQEKKLSGNKDTGAYRAQNVAATKIPRGIRMLAAIYDRLASLDPELRDFVIQRLKNEGGQLALDRIEAAIAGLQREREEAFSDKARPASTLPKASVEPPAETPLAVSAARLATGEDPLTGVLVESMALMVQPKIDPASITVLRNRVDQAEMQLGRASSRASLSRALLDFIEAMSGNPQNLVAAERARDAFRADAPKIGDYGDQILKLMERALQMGRTVDRSPDARVSDAFIKAVSMLEKIPSTKPSELSDLRSELQAARGLLGRPSVRASLCENLIDFMAAVQSGDLLAARESAKRFEGGADRIGEAGKTIASELVRILKVQDTPSPSSSIDGMFSPSELNLIFVMVVASQDLKAAAYLAYQLWTRKKSLAPGTVTPPMIKIYQTMRRPENIEAFRAVRGALVAILIQAGVMGANDFSELDQAAKSLAGDEGAARIDAVVRDLKQAPVARSTVKADQNVIDRTVEKIKNNEKVKVCFVCTANMNRSAIAHILTQDQAKKNKKSNLEVVSGGLITAQLNDYDGKPLQNAPVQPDYLPELRKAGVDEGLLLDFKSQQITKDKLEADLVVAASSKHKEMLLAQFPNIPGLSERIVLFTELDPQLFKDYGDEMPDPQSGQITKAQLINLTQLSVLRRLFEPSAARLAQTAGLQDNPYRSPESEIRKYGFGSASKLLVAYFKHPLLSALLTQFFLIAVIYAPSEYFTAGSESRLVALASLNKHAFLLIYSSVMSVLGAPLLISSSRIRVEEAVYDQLERWVEDGGRKPDLTVAEERGLREGRALLGELAGRFETGFWRHLISVLKGLLDTDRNAVMIRAVEFLKAHENGVETTADLAGSEGVYAASRSATHPAVGARLAKRKKQEILALDERISDLEDRIRTRFTVVEPRIGPAVIDLFERTVRVKFATALGAVRAEYCRTIDVSSIRTRNLISHITLMNSDGPDNLQSYFGRGTVNSTQMQAFIVTLEDLTHWSSQYEDPEFWSWVGQFTALTEQRQSLNGAFEPINRPLPLATEVPGGLFYDLASGPYFRNFLQSLNAKQKYFAIDMDPFVVAYLNEWARIYGVEDRFSAVRSDVMRWKKPAEPVGVVRIKNVWNYVDGFGSKLDEVLGTGVTPTEPWIMPGGALLLQTDSESDHHQLLSSINSVNRQAQILIGSGWSFEGYLDDPGLVYALDQMIFRRPQAGEEKKAIRSAGIMISRWESFRLKVLEESDVRRRERMRMFGGDLFGSLLSGFLSGNFSVIDSLDVDFIEDDEDDDSITNGARLAGRLDSRNPFAYSDALEKAAGPGARLAMAQEDPDQPRIRTTAERVKKLTFYTDQAIRSLTPAVTVYASDSESGGILEKSLHPSSRKISGRLTDLSAIRDALGKIKNDDVQKLFNILSELAALATVIKFGGVYTPFGAADLLPDSTVSQRATIQSYRTAVTKITAALNALDLNRVGEVLVASNAERQGRGMSYKEYTDFDKVNALRMLNDLSAELSEIQLVASNFSMLKTGDGARLAAQHQLAAIAFLGSLENMSKMALLNEGMKNDPEFGLDFGRAVHTGFKKLMREYGVRRPVAESIMRLRLESIGFGEAADPALRAQPEELALWARDPKAPQSQELSRRILGTIKGDENEYGRTINWVVRNLSLALGQSGKEGGSLTALLEAEPGMAEKGRLGPAMQSAAKFVPSVGWNLAYQFEDSLKEARRWNEPLTAYSALSGNIRMHFGINYGQDLRDCNLTDLKEVVNYLDEYESEFANSELKVNGRGVAFRIREGFEFLKHEAEVLGYALDGYDRMMASRILSTITNSEGDTAWITEMIRDNPDFGIRLRQALEKYFYGAFYGHDSEDLDLGSATTNAMMDLKWIFWSAVPTLENGANDDWRGGSRNESFDDPETIQERLLRRIANGPTDPDVLRFAYGSIADDLYRRDEEKNIDFSTRSSLWQLLASVDIPEVSDAKGVKRESSEVAVAAVGNLAILLRELAGLQEGSLLNDSRFVDVMGRFDQLFLWLKEVKSELEEAERSGQLSSLNDLNAVVSRIQYGHDFLKRVDIRRQYGARLAMDRREFLGRMAALSSSMDKFVTLGAQAVVASAAGDAVAADPFADIGEYFVQSALRRMKLGAELRPDDGAVQEVFAQSPELKEMLAPGMAGQFEKWSRGYAENAEVQVGQLTARYAELTGGNSESAIQSYGKQLRELLDSDIKSANYMGDILKAASHAAQDVLDPEGKTRPRRIPGGLMDRNAQRFQYLANIKKRLREFEIAPVEAQKRTFAAASARLMESARRQVEETIASIPEMKNEWKSRLGGDAATATSSTRPPHELLRPPAELPGTLVNETNETAGNALKELGRDHGRLGESVPIALTEEKYVMGVVTGEAAGDASPASPKSLVEKVEEEIQKIGTAVESTLSKRFPTHQVSLGFVFNVKNMTENLEKNAAMIRAVARWPVPAGKSGRKVFILNPGGETRLPEDLAALALVFESWEEFNKIMSDNPDLIFAGIMDVESIRDQQRAVKDQAAQLRLVQVSLTGMNKKTPLVPVAQAGALARIAGQVKSLGMKNEDAVNAFAEIAVDTGLVTAGQTDGLAGFLLTQAESGLSAQEYFTGLEDRALRALESLDKMLGRLVQAARMAAISA